MKGLVMNIERDKVVYDLDLNSPPADSQEGNLTSQDDAVSAAASGAVNSHPLPNIGSYCTPIIVDSDEAEMLSLPTGFPQVYPLFPVLHFFVPFLFVVVVR